MTDSAKFAQFEDRGGIIVKPEEDEYPATLGERTGHPPLHVLGNQEDLHEFGIGLGGSRAVSQSGLDAASAVGRIAAETGLNLVSGYARGADTAGHVAAIDGGGRTTAVLAEGIGRFSRLRADYAHLHDPLEHMTLVSQWGFEARWTVSRAMMRNRVVCALSRVLVAIEPGPKGGTRNAIAEARLQGRPRIILTSKSSEFAEHTGELGYPRAIRVENADELERELRRLLETLDSEDGELRVRDEPEVPEQSEKEEQATLL